ncbi:hypothetical protein JCM10207_000377 [Rhodosporidiobolus poonsookiae]
MEPSHPKESTRLSKLRLLHEHLVADTARLEESIDDPDLRLKLHSALKRSEKTSAALLSGLVDSEAQLARKNAEVAVLINLNKCETLKVALVVDEEGFSWSAITKTLLNLTPNNALFERCAIPPSKRLIVCAILRPGQRQPASLSSTAWKTALAVVRSVKVVAGVYWRECQPLVEKRNEAAHAPYKPGEARRFLTGVNVAIKFSTLAFEPDVFLDSLLRLYRTVISEEAAA